MAWTILGFCGSLLQLSVVFFWCQLGVDVNLGLEKGGAFLVLMAERFCLTRHHFSLG